MYSSISAGVPPDPLLLTLREWLASYTISPSVTVTPLEFSTDGSHFLSALVGKAASGSTNTEGVIPSAQSVAAVKVPLL